MSRGTLMCETRCAVLALALLAAGAARGAEGPASDADDESDSAPFTVAVEHGAGGDWRCSGALLSLRTALTTARCARGPPAAAAPADVWARATQPGAVPAATRVLRIATDAAAEAGDAAHWNALETAHDVALLELAEALGGARPILLAAGRADCVPPRACYAVRSLGAARLRIVELELRAPAACWPHAAAHPADERAMCLAGPALCRSERGAGVVCGGKLCGVLSASLEDGAAPGCGAPHAAGSAPRWRRFLHCAHTRGACGRDGDCAQLCTERWLQEEARAEPPLQPLFAAPEEEPEPPPTAAPTPGSRPPTRTVTREPQPGSGPGPGPASAPPPRTRPPQREPRPPAAPGLLAAPPAEAAPSAGRPALEFEPNRQDFAAGEYGSAADYVGASDESAPGPGPGPAAPAAAAADTAAAADAAAETTPSSATAPDATTLAREHLAGALEAQISSNTKKTKSAASTLRPLSLFARAPQSPFNFYDYLIMVHIFIKVY